MLLCYDMNSERVILELNVYIMSGELLHRTAVVVVVVVVVDLECSYAYV